MSRSNVAEFTAHGICDSHEAGEPFKGRFSLDRSELTVTIDDAMIRIDLSDIFDVQLGPPPIAVNDAFTTPTVTIGFHQDFGHEVLFVCEDEDTIERFGYLLYQVLLDETEVVCRHPAAIRDQPIETTPESGTIRVDRQAVRLTGIEMPVTIDLGRVIDFSKYSRELRGEQRETMLIKHIHNSTPVVTEIAVLSQRTLYLLGRYLRLEYSKVRREIFSLDLSERAIRVLTRIYQLGGDTSVKSLLTDASDSTMEILHKLRRCGVIAGNKGSVELTAKGWILVSDMAKTKDKQRPLTR